jgi:enoyl-[acyl-carrier protein] reductase II
VAANDAATTLFAKRIAPVRAIKNPWVEQVRQAEAAGATREELEKVYGHSHSRRGILEGNVEEGELEAGQSSGLIRDIVSAAEVVRRFVEEFEQNLNRLRRIQS